MIPAARLGDMHQCPRSGHGPSPIISASSDTLINGMGAARVGDTCGCGAVITQGFPSILINGRPLAYMGGTTSHGGRIVGGSSDTFGGFTMGGSGLIMDFARLGAIDEAGKVDDQRLASVLADPDLTQRAMAADALVEPEQSPATEGAQPFAEDSAPKAQKTERATSGIEPGFYIVPESMSRATLEKVLFPQADDRALSHFRSLNPHLERGARPGQMAIIGDPNNLQCTQGEAALMEAAATVDAALESLRDDEARFMVEHHSVLQPFLAYSATSVSTASLMVGRHLKNVSGNLLELERLYQQTYAQHGHLRNESFFTQRRQIMTRLDNSLGPLVRRGVGIPDHPSLKHALGISSRSLVHHWDAAGQSGAIPGYSSHIQGVSRAARYVIRGSYVGVALEVGATATRIHEACTVGREIECRRTTLVEGGKLAGGLGGAAAGGAVGTAAAVTICGAIGLATAGVGGLACGLVVIAAGSAVGGAAGGGLGQFSGDLIYRVSE
ncbi:MAG: PAAR domain-containing protein [Pseudomonadaceae bacterium]